jgi:CMP-N-acetylneuraminic acid synthetase/2-polyprenyl-3-methyl-5-hydroxy-6-metoxy-1,4-benzoquinol methylase
MKHYALIPAKSRSTRCPDKNWKEFFGGGNVVEFVLRSLPRGLFDEVVVSTDRPTVTLPQGVTLHRRPRRLATASAPVTALIPLLTAEYGLEGTGYLWLLNPTSPFRCQTDFEVIRRVLERKRPRSVISMTRLSPYVWEGRTPPAAAAGPRKNTQDLEPRYVENGQFYVFRIADFQRTGSWYFDDTYPHVQHGIGSLLDIDTEQDFAEAVMWARASNDNPRAIAASETLRVDDLVNPPLSDNVKLLSNHLRRYHRAADALGLTRSDCVLDASCGLGYGSLVLGQRAGRVVGLDINENYIARAKQMFGSRTVQFRTYREWERVRCRPVANKVACIETLEHLRRCDVAGFLDRLLSGLCPGGDLFATAPIGRNAPSRCNPYHCCEPTVGRLNELLAPWFERLTLDLGWFENSFGENVQYAMITCRNRRTSR